MCNSNERYLQELLPYPRPHTAPHDHNDHDAYARYRIRIRAGARWVYHSHVRGTSCKCMLEVKVSIQLSDRPASLPFPCACGIRVFDFCAMQQRNHRAFKDLYYGVESLSPMRTSPKTIIKKGDTYYLLANETLTMGVLTDALHSAEFGDSSHQSH